VLELLTEERFAAQAFLAARRIAAGEPDQVAGKALERAARRGDTQARA
jgi:hypothetical protein